MLRTINNLTTSEILSNGEDSIQGVGSDNVISGGNVDDKVNVVGKANTGSSISGTGFLTPGARLAYAKLRQTFSTALILHYFDVECYI